MSEGEGHDEAAAARSWRRRLWPFLKWGLFALVIVFVTRRAMVLGKEAGEQFGDIEIRWPVLCLAGLVYGLGWLPSIWFWRKLMQSCGTNVDVAGATAAYFCGHLGKYIPGKATVLVIRAGLVGKAGGRPGIAALTAAYETLAMMGVGLALGVALAPLLFGSAAVKVLPFLPVLSPVWQVVFPLLVGVGGLALLPTISQLFTKLARTMPPAGFGGDDGAGRPPVTVNTRLLLTGCLAFLAAWAIHGLSLGLTVSSVSGAQLAWSNWPVWTASVALATSVGFVAVFAPGGLGVREGLLIETLRLQAAIPPHVAVAAAVLLRVVWFAAEIILSIVLYLAVVGLRGRKEAMSQGTS